MATIAELVVKISAKDTNLKRGLSSARKRVGQFVKKVAKSLAKMAALVAAAAIAGLAKITSMIKQTAAQMDVLAKTAKKLGVSVEALQRLQFQAKLTGVSAETLNMALQRMVRRISEAAQGTGEAVNALKELGIDAKELARLSPDRQFERIAIAMKRVGNQGDKVRLAMKLFDSEGVALVNTMNSSLEETGAQFDKLGVSISKQQAEAVEAFTDAQLKLSTVWDGFKQQVTAGVAPAFTLIIDKILEVIEKFGGIEVVAIKVSMAIIKSVQVMINALSLLSRALKGIAVLYRSIALAATKLNPRKSSEDVREAENRLGATVNALKATTGASPELTNLLKGLQSQQDALQKGLPGAQDSQQFKQQTFGSITDPITGRTLSIGQQPQQKIGVHITTDKEGIIKAVINNESFQDRVTSQVNTATKDAARATRR